SDQFHRWRLWHRLSPGLVFFGAALRYRIAIEQPVWRTSLGRRVVPAGRDGGCDFCIWFSPYSEFPPPALAAQSGADPAEHSANDDLGRARSDDPISSGARLV